MSPNSFDDTLEDAIAERPNAGLSAYRLGTLCEKIDNGYGLTTVENPFYGRVQLPRDVANNVKHFCEKRGLPSHILARLDYTDAGCAVALLARLCDRTIADRIAAICLELDEVETTEMEAT